MPDNTEGCRYFLRSQSEQNKSNNLNCFSQNIITNTGPVTLRDELAESIKDYWIPSLWPVGKQQHGHTCGLYALDTALRYGYGRSDIDTPPARKDKIKNIISLRQIAKEKGLTSFGEIFNVNSLKVLTDHFKFSNCEILKLNIKDSQKYTQAICNKLKQNYTIIASCDLDGYFPGNSKGLHTHWVVIFGYFYLEDKCYLLTTQYGHYYLFPADKLFQSNKQLPEKNPKSYPNYIYYKNKDSKYGYFRKKKPHEDLSGLKIKYAIEDSLDDFRFSLFCIPVIDAPPCVDIEGLSHASSTQKVFYT